MTMTFDEIISQTRGIQGFLKEAIEKRLDPYKHVASKMYNVPYDQVTPEQRRQIKSISFGALYDPAMDKILETGNDEGARSGNRDGIRELAGPDRSDGGDRGSEQ